MNIISKIIAVCISCITDITSYSQIATSVATGDTTYIDGKLFSVGKKINGQRVGVWHFDFRDGFPHEEHHYNKDSTLLIIRYANTSGYFATEIEPFRYSKLFVMPVNQIYISQMDSAYIDEYDIIRKHGPSKSYYPNHVVYQAGRYEKGKKQGEWKAFYPDQALMNKIQFADDMYHGEFITYFQIESRVMVKGQCYKNGKTGEWTEYYLNGKIASSGSYVKPNKYVFADPDYYERIFKKYPYVQPLILYQNGTIPLPVKEGKWRYFDYLGNLERIEYYRKGKFIKTEVKKK